MPLNLNVFTDFWSTAHSLPSDYFLFSFFELWCGMSCRACVFSLNSA